jgi:hypothetical protein
MADINNLLKIRVINQMTGQKFNVIGFISDGDDRAGLYVRTIKLFDVDNRTFHMVHQGSHEMKALSIIQE